MGLLKDEVSNVYGLLTVVSRHLPNKGPYAMWNCECECGKTKVAEGRALRQGKTVSCGCIKGRCTGPSKHRTNRTGRIIGPVTPNLKIRTVAEVNTLLEGL